MRDKLSPTFSEPLHPFFGSILPPSSRAFSSSSSSSSAAEKKKKKKKGGGEREREKDGRRERRRRERAEEAASVRHGSPDGCGGGYFYIRQPSATASQGTSREKAAFDKGVGKYLKNFNMVRREVVSRMGGRCDKTVADCVRFYYDTWKFTRAYKAWKRTRKEVRLQTMEQVFNYKVICNPELKELEEALNSPPVTRRATRGEFSSSSSSSSSSEARRGESSSSSGKKRRVGNGTSGNVSGGVSSADAVALAAAAAAAAGGREGSPQAAATIAGK